MRLSRRELLRCGSVGTLGLAGCARFTEEETTETPTATAASESPTATDAPTATETDTPTPTVADCETTVEGTVDEDETWGSECGRIKLRDDVRVVDAATLTIEPGVTVVAAEGTELAAKSGGAIAAEGTAEDLIRFQGESAVPGYWNGLVVASNAPNALSNVVVEHAGNGGSPGVTVTGRGRISATTVRESAGVGMKIDAASDVETFENNAFEANEDVGLEVGADAVGALDAASTYAADNGEDHVRVVGEDVTADQTWPAPDAPFFLSEGLDVDGGLTVSPGAEFVVAQRTEINVRDGFLDATGAADDAITFRAPSDVPGYWGGIQFRSSNPRNRLEHVTVAHGGGTNLDGAVTVDNGHLSLVQSTVRRSETYGLFVQGALREFAGNAFERNQEAPVMIEADRVGSLDGDSAYAGDNERDRIEVDPRSRVESDQTWPATDAPYYLNTLEVAAELSFDDGAELRFSRSAELEIEPETGTIVATSEDEPITFRGANAAPGYWNGVVIQSDDPNNEFVNAEIAYATTGIEIGNERAVVRDSYFHDVEGDAIAVDQNGSLTASGNTFENVGGEHVNRDA